MDEHAMTMQLFFSPGSPFARKVRVLARERGLMGVLQETALSPHDDAPEFLQTNPLGKVPALRKHDLTLFDSPVICEYLDTLGSAPRLVPPDGAARIVALRAQALGDGVMDAAVATVFEMRRPEAMQSPRWLRRWRAAIDRTLTALADAPPAATGFDIGTISIACALEYLDFRFPDIAWRDAHPLLAAWLDKVSRRDSMLATRPPSRRMSQQ
jgi:glutathione S-transferase